jgi:hypothetical protein
LLQCLFFPLYLLDRWHTAEEFLNDCLLTFVSQEDRKRYPEDRTLPTKPLAPVRKTVLSTSDWLIVRRGGMVVDAEQVEQDAEWRWRWRLQCVGKGEMQTDWV